MQTVILTLLFDTDPNAVRDALSRVPGVVQALVMHVIETPNLPINLLAEASRLHEQAFAAVHRLLEGEAYMALAPLYRALEAHWFHVESVSLPEWANLFEQIHVMLAAREMEQCMSRVALLRHPVRGSFTAARCEAAGHRTCAARSNRATRDAREHERAAESGGVVHD